MNTIWFILAQLTIVFAGFSIGRIGDKYLGHLKAPHHWIWSLISMAAGIIFYKIYPYDWIISAITFGSGLLVSDLDDLLHLRIYGPDHVRKKNKWNFWHID